MRAVVRKDLTQHGPLILPGLGLCGLLLLVLSGRRFVVGDRIVFSEGAAEQGFADFVCFVLAPFAILLARQLVLPELRDGGLQVLRRLPVGLGRVFWAKAATGAALTAALTACGLGLSTSLIRLGGRLDAKLVETLAVGSLAWLALVWAGALLWASLGRFRHAGLLVALLAGTLGLGDALLEPPRRLLAAGFSTDEGAAATALLAGALLVAGAALWSARGGAWLQALGGPLRPADHWRALALAAALVAVAGDEVPAPPQLIGDVVRRGHVTVRLPAPGQRARADELALRAAAVLDAVERRVGLPPPPLSIEHGPALGRRYERAIETESGGLLVRLDVEAGDRSPHLDGWLAAAALDESTRGRLRAAPWRLLLDGYAGWFQASPDDPVSTLRAAWGAAALEARGEAVGPGLFVRWDRVRAALGDPVAQSLAAWVLAQLAQQTSPTAVDALIARVAQDRVATLAALRTSDSRWPGLAGEVLARPLSGLELELGARAGALVRAHAKALARLSSPTPGEVRPALADGQVRLAFRGAGRLLLLHTAAGSDPAPLHYHRDEGDPSRERLLTGTAYPPGTRLRYAFAAWIPELGCDVVSGWHELQLP